MYPPTVSKEKLFFRALLKATATPDVEGLRLLTWSQLEKETGLSKAEAYELRSNQPKWIFVCRELRERMYPVQIMFQKRGIRIRPR